MYFADSRYLTIEIFSSYDEALILFAIQTGARPKA